MGRYGYVDEPVGRYGFVEEPKGKGGSTAQNVVVGALRGVKDVIDTGADWLSRLGPAGENERVKAMNAEGKADFEREYGGSTAASVARVGGNVAATWPVGGVLGAGVRSLSAAPAVQAFGNAIATGGMRAGSGAPVANMLTRMGGGAVTGGASAALVNPDDLELGMAVGAALPPALRGAHAAGSAIARGARSAFASENTHAVRAILEASGAKTPEEISAVIQQLRQSGPSLIPGSVPTVPQLLQTPGTSQLQRTVKAVAPGPLADAEMAQNAARLAALDRISPVSGTLEESARNAGTAIERFAIPARQAESQAVSRAFESVDPFNETAFELPIGAMRSARDRYLGPGTFGTGSRASAAIDEATRIGTRTLDAGADGLQTVARPVTWRELQNLRSSISEAAEQASAKGASKEAAALRQMVGDIDGRVSAVASGRGGADEIFPADMVKTWRDAIGRHEAKQQRFATGPQASMFRKGADGQAAIQGAEIPGKFYSARGSQFDDMQAFNRLIGDNDPLRDVLKNYAVTQAAGQTDRLGTLTNTKFNHWLDARSGANSLLFNPGENATLRAIGRELERSDLAEGLGRSTNSDTVQKAASALRLGLIDNPLVGLLANRTPLIGGITGPLLQAAKESGKKAKAEKLGGLLADPELTAELIGGLLRPTYSGGLLSAAEPTVLPLLYRGAPLLSSDR